MRALLALLAAAIVCACETDGPVSSVTPNPGGTRVTPVPSPVDFYCSLPIYFSENDAYVGWFIDFPVGSGRRADGNGLSYDRAVSRWLPVPQSQVSTDGTRYAYTEGFSVSPPTPARLHIADAATGNDLKVITMPVDGPNTVIAYTPAGIDMVPEYENTGPGVWRVDPGTGRIAKLSEGYDAPGAVWVGAFDERDTDPYSARVSGPVINRIDRRDASGQLVTWFYRPGQYVSWVPFLGDSQLLVEATSIDPVSQSQRFEFWLVSAPGQEVKLAEETVGTGPFVDLVDGFYRAVADEHGIWIGGESLYLVSSAVGLKKVYDTPAHPAYPAGTCA